MLISTSEHPSECSNYRAIRILSIRAAFLFTNFFFIIMALYQLKPASRSLFIESLGADQLPYVWIGTALTIGAVIIYYNRLVERHSRLRVVLGSCLLFSGLLVVFRLMLISPSSAISVCFYIFVDILGVVLVEQFWSLTNSIYSTDEGKSWYGLVGTGGLVGGVVGGGVAAFLIRRTPLQTPDLLLVAAGIIFLIFALTLIMGRLGIYCEVDSSSRPVQTGGGWRAVSHSRYLILIASILLLAQLASPFVEFQGKRVRPFFPCFSAFSG
jgi:AAA family ATP:ADP antiporter